MYKRTWGRSIIKYCPVNNVCWQVSKGNELSIYKDFPTYGLERKELPREFNKGGI